MGDPFPSTDPPPLQAEAISTADWGERIKEKDDEKGHLGIRGSEGLGGSQCRQYFNKMKMYSVYSCHLKKFWSY